MKFVYFGYDHMLPAARRLIDDGHEMVGVFTFNCDNVFNFNVETIALGEDLGVPVLLEQPADYHIEQYIKAGAEVFIGAGFPAKIPVPLAPEEDGGAYAINMHPSLLPAGRGLMPTPTIIMKAPEAAGITVHKLTEGFDEGDILAQKALPLASDETVDSYSARVAQDGVELLSSVMSDLPAYWAGATKQDKSKASVFSTPDDEMRMVKWTMDVDEIDKIARAFGSFGCLCEIDGVLYAVYELAVEAGAHEHGIGQVLSDQGDGIAVACADGVVRLRRYQRLEA